MVYREPMEEKLKQVRVGHVVTILDKMGKPHMGLVAHIDGTPNHPIYHYVDIDKMFTRDDITDIDLWHPIVSAPAAGGKLISMHKRRRSKKGRSKN